MIESRRPEMGEGAGGWRTHTQTGCRALSATAPTPTSGSADFVLPSEDVNLVEGAPSAPPISGLLTENQVDSDDDDSFIIEESGSGVHMARGGLGLGDDLNDEDKQHGILVTKILQSKEELGDGSFVPGERGASKGPAALTVTVDEAARKRERQATEREMERLSQALQSLTRSALPLGKLVDFLQEDLESMQTEYREWKAEDQRLQLQLNMVLK
ncbi:unnamed protein product [Schistocephalus solidus]|uniref:MIP-T3_C domain-containing protein n=1 Tax=Schistocephalus solidus TaxID=70667 RepID=A0A183SSL8_SCHSO|nr:unnamed protein product [Schistocephalus solidus]